MHDIFAGEPDPLEGMLAAPPLPANALLRQELLTRTARALRRRRRGRQLAWAAALAASYAAGLLTMRWAQKPVEVSRAPDVMLSQNQLPRPKGVFPPADEPGKSALRKEWEAVESGRAALFRQAGDLYLGEEGDLQAAVRCYGNALSVGAEVDLTISPQDNWLLMAIKDARQKEKRNAKNGS
jgi:hypothetical protein